MVLIHVGKSTIIYLANGNTDFLGTGGTPGCPGILKITITRSERNWNVQGGAHWGRPHLNLLVVTARRDRALTISLPES